MTNNIKQEWLDFIEWCKQNGKEPKNANSLHEHLAKTKSDKK